MTLKGKWIIGLALVFILAAIFIIIGIQGEKSDQAFITTVSVESGRVEVRTSQGRARLGPGETAIAKETVIKTVSQELVIPDRSEPAEQIVDASPADTEPEGVDYEEILAEFEAAAEVEVFSNEGDEVERYDRAVLIPPEKAVVLDPNIPLRDSSWAGSNSARFISSENNEGFSRFKVNEPGKVFIWTRYFDLPIDVQTYPIIVLHYRAKNTNTINKSYNIWLDDTTGPNGGGFVPFQNSDLIPDGEVHELRRDLREFEPKGDIIGMAFGVACSDTGHTTLDLLGLRFEADPDNDVPTIVEEDLPLIVKVVGSDGKPIKGAEVTVDAERPNFASWALTGADGKVELETLANSNGKHMVRVEKEGMVPVWQKDIALEEESGPVQIVLPTGAYYGGIVQDEEGEPIEGVAVSLLVPSREIKSGMRRHYTVTTNSNGRWRSDLLPADLDDIWIKLAHPEYISDSHFGGTQKPPLKDLRKLEGVMVMRMGLGFSGRVVDE